MELIVFVSSFSFLMSAFLLDFQKQAYCVGVCACGCAHLYACVFVLGLEGFPCTCVFSDWVDGSASCHSASELITEILLLHLSPYSLFELISSLFELMCPKSKV